MDNPDFGKNTDISVFDIKVRKFDNKIYPSIFTQSNNIFFGIY